MAIRFPQRCGFYVSDGSLSFCGKRKGGKNAAKTKVLESFSRLRCRPRRSPLTSRTGMCKICTLLSDGLCGAIRWPLTRARAALTQQEYALRLPCYAQYFLSSFRRGRCLHRPARETRRVAGHVGPVLHSVALPEPGGQGRPLLQGERIPTPVCALVRNDRVNFWGVIARPVTDVTGLGDPFSPALQKEVTLRPPLNFCLRGGAYSSSSWPTRAICNSSSCFCTPHKMAEHFAGPPRIDFNPRRK